MLWAFTRFVGGSVALLIVPKGSGKGQKKNITDPVIEVVSTPGAHMLCAKMREKSVS